MAQIESRLTKIIVECLLFPPQITTKGRKLHDNFL